MNRIESAVTEYVTQVTPLDTSTTVVPVATPFAVAGVVGGAFLAGAAVGCAEGHCVGDTDAMNGVGEVDGMSVSALLKARREAV